MSKPSVSKFAQIDAELAGLNGGCKTCDFLANPARYDSDSSDVVYIDGLLRDASKGASHVSNVLKRGGVTIGESSIKRHRQNHLER